MYILFTMKPSKLSHRGYDRLQTNSSPFTQLDTQSTMGDIGKVRAEIHEAVDAWFNENAGRMSQDIKAGDELFVRLNGIIGVVKTRYKDIVVSRDAEEIIRQMEKAEPGGIGLLAPSAKALLFLLADNMLSERFLKAEEYANRTGYQSTAF